MPDPAVVRHTGRSGKPSRSTGATTTLVTGNSPTGVAVTGSHSPLRDAVARMPVPRTATAGSPSRPGPERQPAVTPTGHGARLAGRLERDQVAGAAPVRRAAVDHQRRAASAPGEVVRHVRPGLALFGCPPQPERLRGDPGHALVPVQPRDLDAPATT